MKDSSFHSRDTIPPDFTEIVKEEAPPVPKQIGRFKIETIIEKGGMSFLYLAEDLKTNEPVIVKILSPRFLKNSEVIKRFLNEAEIIRSADHPNIVKLLDSGKWENGLYIAMEYVEGITLRKYLQKNPVSLKRALEIILEISYALCHLHTHRVIHRDLKPENILIDRAGKVKVIDFGIAQLSQAGKQLAKGEATHFAGTPIYMSPEQKESPSNVSYPSDIYSLGIIAYELILGKLSRGQIVLSLMPQGLQKILAKALMPSPNDRHHDIVDFIGEISAYLHSSQIRKDQKPADPFLDELEKLKETSRTLLSPKELELSHFDLGFSHDPYTTTKLSYNLKEFSDGVSAVYFFESTAKELSSLLSYMYVKGLTDSEPDFFTKEDPEKGILKINEHLISSNISEPLLLAYIQLDPKEKKGFLITCGNWQFFLINANGIDLFPITGLALGIDPALTLYKKDFTYDSSDMFLLAPISGSLEKLNWKTLIQESLSSTPQKFTDNLFWKLKMKAPRFVDERSPFLFSFSLLQ